MKNLFLVVAFMLSIGAFAQGPKPPEEGRPELCYYAFYFEPECPLKVYTSTGLGDLPHAIYSLEICGKNISSMGSKAIIQMVQDYICEYGYFPIYVKILNQEFI
ncbi:hypothetical protein [Myroides odoratus]|uniref:Uncharacterized protein n=1 Tax=Myroides odoratus TaxID=256 RepID=A0A9Q6Z7H1_MYROD|nr:hypothetical protein [Myroides odoratus]EHQ44494.1 hypothetical protein Myrod_3697 [Myroides odoratus DSM 2801]EKB03678.1 hypothetical protein HMPREF9716_03507 [Myroides odoratus CIP 103059]QQU01762.1 hypothetical protein I6I88_08485 [Myroides odoratus]WQD55955.1 hypothetical protein U0010_10500 [Myroides odoratus]STZ31833.1 Uncharacterised protein [Myroides odoratus]